LPLSVNRKKFSINIHDSGTGFRKFLNFREYARISGSANPHCNFVIASQGEMASFPAGTTPFFIEIESAREVPSKKSPARWMTQLTSSTPTLCRSAIPWEYLEHLTILFFNVMR
jgi:hypothetical protein